ncbi:MAG: uridine kinase [Ekhidna sp.]
MDKPIVVGITGGSGSGKTLFMKELIARLPDSALHSLDNYYFPIEKQPLDSKGVENFDRLESIDQERFLADLIKLINGETIEFQEYTFNNDRSTSRLIRTESKPVILVEGIFVLYVNEIRELMDLKLFIEAPDYLMMKRRIIRDAKERGYDLDDVMYRYEHHVTPAYQQFIEPSKKYADLIIPNHDKFEVALEVISAFLNR